MPQSSDGLFRNFGDIAVGPDGQVLVSYVVDPGSSIQPDQGSTRSGRTGAAALRGGRDGHGNQRAHRAPRSPRRTRRAASRIKPSWPGIAATGRTAAASISFTPMPSRCPTRISFCGIPTSMAATWSEPIQVNDDGTTNSQFFPSIAVDQSYGKRGRRLAQRGGEQRRDPLCRDDQRRWRIHLPRRLRGQPRQIRQHGRVARRRTVLLFSYGDYTGLSFVNGMLQPIWADNSLELDATFPTRGSSTWPTPGSPWSKCRGRRWSCRPSTSMDVEGNEFTVRIATFSDPGGARRATAYHATIDWGDGTEASAGDIQLAAGRLVRRVRHARVREIRPLRGHASRSRARTRKARPASRPPRSTNAPT